MKVPLLIAAALGIFAMDTAAQPAPENTAPENMTPKVWVDRTALYPGDRLEYIARVEHSPDIEFVQDHVRKDQLSLDPFEILQVSTAQGNLPGGRKYFEVKLFLTTYDTGHPDATVPSFNLFYFRRSQSASKDTAAAETLAVPPVKVGLRSTIADLPGAIRVQEPPLSLSRIDWILPGVLGLCGLAAVIVYFASFALASLRSGFWKQQRTERIRKKSIRESFEEIRHSPTDTPEHIEVFYSKASMLLRGVASEKVGECAGFTPREMQAALRQSGDREDHATAMGDLLEQCDLVRYSPGGAESVRARHPEFMRKLADLIEQG